MADVRDEDFAAALTTAEKCILDGNGLIKTVQTYGENYLIPRLQELCQILDEGQGTIPKVSHWHRVVSSGPFGTPPETEATAHELAWRFAYRLWLGIFNLLSGQEEFDHSGEPTMGPGFAFRPDVVLRHIGAVADHLREQSPLDYYDLRPHLRLERDKALAQFRQGASSGAEIAIVMPDGAPPAAQDTQDPDGPVQFLSGTLEFFDDRVELCGVDICSGDRSKNARAVLNALAERRNGRFVTYDGDELVTKTSLTGGKNSVYGLVRTLRKRIRDVLLAEANIRCSLEDVILSRGRGYQFADCLSVQFVGDESEPALLGQNSGGDDPVNPGDIRRGPVNGPVSGPIDVTVSDTSGPVSRKAWILHQVESGRELRVPQIANELGCSERTAKRDLDDLKDEKRIEFVGAPKTGFYKLSRPAHADD